MYFTAATRRTTRIGNTAMTSRTYKGDVLSVPQTRATLTSKSSLVYSKMTRDLTTNTRNRSLQAGASAYQTLSFSHHTPCARGHAWGPERQTTTATKTRFAPPRSPRLLDDENGGPFEEPILRRSVCF